MKLPNSKRLRITVFTFVVNALLFGYGMYKEVELASLGAGLALINSPIMAYLGAESYKPSKKENDGGPISDV